MAESGEKDLHKLGTEEDTQRANWTQSGDTDLGIEDEVSDVKYNALVQEVCELSATVAEYREKGPGQFAALVERSLSAFRQLPVVDSAPVDPSAKGDKFSELISQTESLTQRLDAATGSLPSLLKELKDCTSRLDSLIAIVAQ